MPRVPVYNQNVPDVVESGRMFGAPAENVHPNFDYQSVMTRAMEPLDRAASTFAKIEAHYRDTSIKARADEQLDAFNREVQDTLYSPEGYFNQKGKNAVDNWNKSQQTLSEIYNRHLGQIEDNATKQAFMSSALPQVNTLRQKSILYRNSQNDAWRINASKAHIKNLTNQFAYSGFGEGSQETFASLMNEIEYQGRMLGQSSEWVQRQKEAHSSLAYASAYEMMMTEDPSGALRHFQNQGQKQMAPHVAQRVFANLFSMNRKEIAARIDNMGGTTALALTSGAVSRQRGGGNTQETIDGLNLKSPKVDNVRSAQQGIGTPPKVEERVLNTSGYKGCNPLNIRATGEKWQGAIGQTDNGYLIFGSPVDGIRSAAKVILTYNRKYGIDTVSGIVSRFAPSTENPTEQYINEVCKKLDVKPDEKIDVTNPETMRKLIKAMMKQEIGGDPYSDETLNVGILRAMNREDVRDYSEMYNTELTPEEEVEYQAWAKRIGHEKDVYNYDLRGAWKAGAGQVENGNFPDKFKKPNHETFSNESKYHNGGTRIGGHWEQKDGQKTFVGTNGQLKDDNGQLIEQKVARLTTQDLVLNPDVKTGYDLFDNLPRAYKFMILQDVKVQKSQSSAQMKNELSMQVKNGLAQALNTGDISAMPTEDAFISVYGQLAGTEQFKESQRQAILNANIYSMPGMTTEQLNQMSKQLMPDKGDPQYKARLEQKELWDKAMAATIRNRQEDPVKFAMQAFPDLKIEGITDWTNQAAVNRQLEQRIMTASEVSARFGTPQALLTKDEVAGFLNNIQLMDGEHKGEYLQNLSVTLFDFDPNNGQALVTLANQIGDKNSNIAVALSVASTDKGRENNGAYRQMQGAFFRKQKTTIGIANDERLLRGKLDKLIPWGEGTRQYKYMFDAVMNEYCFANQYEAQSLDKSIENVFAPIVKWNDYKVLLPTKLEKAQKDFFTFSDEGNFEDVVDDFRKDIQKSKSTWNYQGRKINGNQLSNLINSGRLVTYGDGIYLIADGLRYVTDDKGVPFKMDLNPYIEKRIK